MAGTKTIEGWLIRYNAPSLPITLPEGKKVYEVILSDAFKDSVDAINAGAATIEANIEHNDNAITRIGLSGKNVKVENRPEGVYVTITVLDDSLSNDIFIKAQAGIVSGLSVEFDPIPFDAQPRYSVVDGFYVRAWPLLKLRGFAICTTPCYPDAQIVKATDTGSPATAARSLSKTEAEKIAAEIAKLEDIELLRRQIYEYESFLYGTRR